MPQYDLQLTAGSRCDRVFTWEQSDGTPTGMAGFTAVMIIYAGGEQVYSSLADPPDFILLQEPNGRIGEIDLTIGHALGQKLMVPYEQESPYSYTLDLIDNAMADNSISLLFGSVLVSRAGV